MRDLTNHESNHEFFKILRAILCSLKTDVYDSGTGAITESYRAALKANRLKAFMGNCASMQPGCLQEVMLHEAAMAWLRSRLAKTLPKNCWTESVADCHKRLKACCTYFKDTYDVDGLCRELPLRVQMLVDSKGDRIPK